MRFVLSVIWLASLPNISWAGEKLIAAQDLVIPAGLVATEISADTIHLSGDGKPHLNNITCEIVHGVKPYQRIVKKDAVFEILKFEKRLPAAGSEGSPESLLSDRMTFQGSLRVRSVTSGNPYEVRCGSPEDFGLDEVVTSFEVVGKLKPEISL